MYANHISLILWFAEGREGQIIEPHNGLRFPSPHPSPSRHPASHRRGIVIDVTVVFASSPFTAPPTAVDAQTDGEGKTHPPPPAGRRWRDRPGGRARDHRATGSPMLAGKRRSSTRRRRRRSLISGEEEEGSRNDEEASSSRGVDERRRRFESRSDDRPAAAAGCCGGVSRRRWTHARDLFTSGNSMMIRAAGGGGLRRRSIARRDMPNVEKGAAVRRADGISEQHHDPSGRRIFSLTNPDERSAAFDRVWVLASDHSGNLPSSEFSRRRRSPFEGIERIR